jgi:hypothetical protein
MKLLLITDSTHWFFFGIAFFLLMFVASLFMWAVRTAECYEHEYDPVDHEPVTYDEIIMREHLCADIINN